MGYFKLPLIVTYAKALSPTFKMTVAEESIWPMVTPSPRRATTEIPRYMPESLGSMEARHDLTHVRVQVAQYCVDAAAASQEDDLAKCTDWGWSNEEARIFAARYISVIPISATALPDDIIKACVGMMHGAFELIHPGTAHVWAMAFAPPALKRSLCPSASYNYNAQGSVFLSGEGLPVLAVFNRTDRDIVSGQSVHIWVANALDLDPDISCHIRHCNPAHIRAKIGRASLSSAIGSTIIEMTSMIAHKIDILKTRIGDSAAEKRGSDLKIHIKHLGDLGAHSSETLVKKYEQMTRNEVRAHVLFCCTFLAHSCLMWAEIVNVPYGPVDNNMYRQIANVLRGAIIAFRWVANRMPTLVFHVFSAMERHKLSSGKKGVGTTLCGYPEVGEHMRSFILTAACARNCRDASAT